MNPINIYTDGACSGNPGPGAYAYLVEHEHRLTAIAVKSNGLTTNNQMELQAVIAALESIKPFLRERAVITLYSDSKYVIDGLNIYLGTWLQNGWRTSSKKEVSNIGQWQQLVAIKRTFTSIKFEWVRGHASSSYNKVCDAMAQSLLSIPSEASTQLSADSVYEN